MEKEIKKFLEFNGQEILCRKIDGKWWIAIKPICEALKIDYIRQFKNLNKKDHFLRDLLSHQTMLDTLGSERKMVSLPEFYIYGWLFEVNAKSEEYRLYKWKCYEVLYEYFHGTMTKRLRILEEREDSKRRLEELTQILGDNPEYKELQELTDRLKSFPAQLRSLDQQLKDQQIGLDL